MDRQHPKNLDDVRTCASKLTGVRGLPAVLHLLQRYNATRICEVPEKDYSEFVDHCELMISNSD
jgi:hypothetical protein